MRIAVAHESVGTEGGVETYLLSTIQGLRHRGHQVALVYYRRCDSATPLRSSSHVALGIEEHGIDAVFDELGAWRPDVAFSHNMSGRSRMSPLVRRSPRLRARVPVWSRRPFRTSRSPIRRH